MLYQSIFSNYTPPLIFITWRTDAEAETPILWWPDAEFWLIWKDLDAGKDWRQGSKGMAEIEMVGWHQKINGHEFEQALGVGDGQGSLVCYSPWGPQRVGHNWVTEMNWYPSNFQCETIRFYAVSVWNIHVYKFRHIMYWLLKCSFLLEGKGRRVNSIKHLWNTHNHQN